MRKLLSSVFVRLIRRGELRVIWPDGVTSYFAGIDGPTAGVRLREWQTVRHLALNPALAFGEAYMDGALEPAGCSLYELFDLVMLNSQGMTHPMLRWHETVRKLTRHLRQTNDPTRARQNVAHHYDLDSRLYSLILDRDQQYSCAYFRQGDETLEEAQLAKKRHIAAKLYLDRPGLSVLDIGCGWGGMAGYPLKFLRKTDYPGDKYACVLVKLDLTPGQLVPRHMHPGVESSYIAAGSITLSVAGQPDLIVQAGDGYQIPPETPHSVRNGTEKSTLVATFIVEKDKPLVEPA